MLNRSVRRLEEEIRASELRVIDSDLRLAEALRGMRQGVGRAVTGKLAAGAGLLAFGWLLGRPGRRAQLGRMPRYGRFGRYGRRFAPYVLRRALPLLLPLLTPLLNRKVASKLAAVGLPIGVPHAVAPLRTEPAFRADRFAGLWYEIARLPQRQRRGAGDVMSHYSVDADGMIAVERWRDAQGRIQETAGRLRASDESNPAQL